MQHITLRVFFLLLFTGITTHTQAFDQFSRFPGANNSAVQECYGFAMVGMDSVINSRIGVPAEHALELAKLTKVGAGFSKAYSRDMLENILNAYLWDGTPHSYAINVFFQCAQNQNPLRSASIITVE